MEAFELPVEHWQRIVLYLGPWDALQLRTTSKDLYAIVMTFQSYWYRQFCWYLICQKKRPAMFKTGCHKTHKVDIPKSIACLSTEQEQEIVSALEISISELPNRLLQNPELFDQYVCRNIDHYIYDLPLTRFDIPLDPADYQPNGQVYCYRFLIHNYRQQRQRASRQSGADITRQQKQVQRDLAKIRRDLEKTRSREIYLASVSAQLARMENNRVFHGKKSRQYRGLLE